MASVTDIREYRDLDPVTRVLMGPGPSDVPPRVLRAMATPTIGHLDPEFLALMSETQQLLRDVFQTQNALTIPVSGTGSAGMEACFVNLVEPGEQVAIVVNGVFGARMVDCAGRLGADVIHRGGVGAGSGPVRGGGGAQGTQAKIFAVVHRETSTGVRQPLTDIVNIVKDHGALMMLDCVTSLGGVEVTLDAWGIDAAFSGTQKCLSCPPGLAPLSFNEKAVEKLLARATKVPSWYLDLTMVRDYWGSQRKYHHTAPINMIYALREALRIVLEEGLEARFARHQLNHQALVAGVEAMGLEMLVPPAERLASLNAIVIPRGR
jgi:alanine-glyoxylate transaminase/serine-glyoxylate transaminase/serine-pyruvate transaminase